MPHAWSYKKTKYKKIKAYKKSVQKEPTVKVSVNCIYTPKNFEVYISKSSVKRKAFYQLKIPKPCCTTNKTIDIDNF